VEFPRFLLVAVVLCCGSGLAVAQPVPADGDGHPPEDVLILPPMQTELHPTWIRPGSIDFTPGATVPNPFKSVGGDMKRFFSSDSIRFIGLVGVVAIGVAPWDREGIEESQEHWAQSPGAFQAGNVGGSFLVQTGAALATYGIGTALGSQRTAAFGADMVRAQMVSQVVVQGIKLVTQRPRPDASNNHSFPSGHTASAFATASVVNRHFGWKAGVPAYAFAAYVGASRMSANKHHLSDVAMGAAIGIAAGRTVTVGLGGTRFDVGVAPTQGGAAVTFTKK
jgi:membrane-associated phospholipid phosphatase